MAGSPDSTSVQDPVVQQVFDEIQDELGFGMVPNVFKAMTASPTGLAATWGMFKGVILQGILPRATKEMVGVVVSASNGSEYARRVHLHSLGVQGVQDSVLHALDRLDLADGVLPASLETMMRFARKATREPRSIDDGDYASLQESGLEAAEIGELLATIALFQAVNSFTDAAHVPVDALG